jgi:hypothetical protein
LILKEAVWKCLKILVVIFIVLSSLLAVYVRWKGGDFDPIREIQRPRNEGQRDDALDVVKFLKENNLGDPEKISDLEKDLHYGFFEILKSVVWNGIIKGEVFDTYSGIGAVSADITMFGDLRDLVIQTWKRIRGDPDTDNWVMCLSAAGVSLSTIPFLNESYALAKSLAKYSERLPSMCLNAVLVILYSA